MHLTIPYYYDAVRLHPNIKYFLISQELTGKPKIITIFRNINMIAIKLTYLIIFGCVHFMTIMGIMYLIQENRK